MSDDYGSDFISISDDEGQEFELEHLDTIEVNGITYMAFLPADTDEDAEEYGIILLKVVEEGDEAMLASIDDEDEKNLVYDAFVTLLFNGDDENESE